MSLTGSLVSYENNNELNSKKNRSLLNTTNSSIAKPPCSSLNSSLNTSVATTSSIGTCNMSKGQGSVNNSMSVRERKTSRRKGRFHLNTLWSIWYGALFTILQGYLAIQGAHRFLVCSLLQWQNETPTLELNIQIVLCGFVFVILPLFLITALFKIGNLANDGVKLGTSSSTVRRCSADPHDGLEEESKGGTVRAMWTHGGPSSAFLHIVMALALLIPRLLIESRMIQTGLLPKDFVWRTELDLFSDNLPANNVMMMTVSNSPYSNDSRVHADNPDHRHALFEKTHLIDQFYAEDEIEESLFEKIEMDPELDWHNQPAQVPLSEEEEENEQQQPTTSTTMAPTHRVVPQARADDFEAESFELPPAQSQPAKHHRKAKNKHHHNNNNNNGRSRKAHQGRRSKQQRKEHEDEDEFDSNLELKPERNVPFDKLNSFEMGPQSIQFEVNKNGRRQYQSQRPQHSSMDSDVHVVQPQDPETVTFSVDSKIIDIRSRNTNQQQQRRIKRDMEEALAATTTSSNGNKTPSETEQRNQNALAAFLAKFFGVQTTGQQMDMRKWMAMPALEFLNLIVAILVWSVRYPSVFWATSKPFSIIFTVQMVANGLSIVYDYLGCSILYKLQVVNEAAGIKSGPLLLNALVTVCLLLLSVLLILGSSHILYMYGHGKLSLKMRERKVISVKSSQAWVYFSHCASLCFVLALAVVKAPLLHDLTMTYRENLSGTLFASALISVCQLFVWVVLWLGLTAKRRWGFKLPPITQQHHQHSTAVMHPGKQKILNGMAGNVTEPLLPRSPPPPQHLMEQQMPLHHPGIGPSPIHHQNFQNVHQMDGGEEIYWPKNMQPNSPKMKVTFNEVTSMSTPSTSSSTDPTRQNYALAGGEHGGKRGKTRGAQICVSGVARETYDDGDYAVLRGGPITDLRLLSDYPPCDSHLTDDNTSEEGKLLESVRDDSVTYASTRDLEPPGLPPPPPPLEDSNNNSSGYASQLVSPLAPVTVTVHTNEAHITSNMTPRCLRADSGMAGDALLTPSTESSASPPDRAPSETSSGVHSGEESAEVVIRPGSISSGRPSPYKPVIKPVPPPIAEEPFGRSTNMRMSSFNINGNRHSHQSLTGSTSVNNHMGGDGAATSATLPLLRSGSSLTDYHPLRDYAHCSTMPLPGSNGHQNPFMNRQQIQQPPHLSSDSSVAAQYKHLNQLNNNNNNTNNSTPVNSNHSSPAHPGMGIPQHTTLPNGVRYANPMLTRRVPHLKNAESPYGVLGMGSGHHTFSKLLHDPLMEMSIPEGSDGHLMDTTNYAMISEELYIADLTGSGSSNYVALPPMDNNIYANNNY